MCPNGRRPFGDFVEAAQTIVSFQSDSKKTYWRANNDLFTSIVQMAAQQPFAKEPKKELLLVVIQSYKKFIKKWRANNDLFTSIMQMAAQQPFAKEP